MPLILVMPDERQVTVWDDDAHLGAARLAAFVDGTIDAEARLELVRHLASCGTCRDELADVQAMVAAAPAAQSRGIRRLVPLAAFAAMLLMMVITRPSDVPTANQVSVRRAPLHSSSDAPPAVSLVTPIEDALLMGTDVRLAWRDVEGDATYLVVVQDSTGTVVWSAVTRDTIAVVPRPVSLAPAGEYFWSVDAQWGDGRSSRSAARRFTVQ